MWLQNSGHQPAELEGSRKRPDIKARNLKSRLKSIRPNLTAIRRPLILVVILFHVFLVLYLARTHNLSPSVSPQASPKISILSKSPGSLPKKDLSNISSKSHSSLLKKDVSNISSKTHVSLPNKLNMSWETLSSLPKKGVPNISSKTHASLPKKGVLNISSKSHHSLTKKGISYISSETYASLLDKGVSNISSETHASLPDKGLLNISSETYGSLQNKGVSNISSKTHASLPNKGVSNISSKSYASLPNKGVLNVSSKTHVRLPNKVCKSGRIYVYDLPPMFNYDMVNNCTDIVPKESRCDKFLNDGFGPAAAREFAGIVPESILPAFYWTDMYWNEVVFHNRMLNYKCRTLEPESATAFHIPYYAGLRLRKYLFHHTARERDWHPEMLIKWLQQQKWWKRLNGSDHFIVFGRMIWEFSRVGDGDTDWGTSFRYMPAMKNVIRVTTERDVWDDLEIAVPYPSIFHPRSESDIVEWQEFARSRHRNHLFTFVGAGRPEIKNDFRQILLDKCLNESTACRHVDCSKGKCRDSTATLEAFLDSDFCFQPRGDGMTRRSVFDCMLAGSIPVFFWSGTAYDQYKLSFVPDEPKSYSVFINHNDVRNGTDINSVLKGYEREEVERMREKVIKYIPRFMYARSSQALGKTQDAFDIAIDGLMTKYRDRMERGRFKTFDEI